MWMTAIESNYGRYQSGVVTNLMGGSAVGTLQTLPVADTTVVKPDKILVQGHPLNSGYILIGQNSPLNEDGSNGGHCLAPGEMFVLPDNDISAWFIRGSGVGGQKLLYTYYAGTK